MSSDVKRIRGLIVRRDLDTPAHALAQVANEQMARNPVALSNLMRENVCAGQIGKVARNERQDVEGCFHGAG